MNKFLSIILIWFLCTGASYYVKNGGSDAADGLSDGSAWETVAKVNSASPADGDHTYFNKGDSWAEKLIIPTSGAVGNPITFSSYGTGEKPVINGCDIINMNFIILDGLELNASGNIRALSVEDSDHLIVRNCKLDGKSLNTDVDGESGGEVINMTATGFMYNLEIYNNEILNGGTLVSEVFVTGGGIKLNGSYQSALIHQNTVYNNIETNIQVGAGDIPENLWSNDVIVSDNIIYNTGANTLSSNYETGINLGWRSKECIAERNYVHDVYIGIEIDSISKQNVIRNNLIINSPFMAIRTLANTYGTNDAGEIYNNTIISTLSNSRIADHSSTGISVTGTIENNTNGIIKNNLSYSLLTGFIHFHHIETGGASNSFNSDYNLFHTVASAETFNWKGADQSTLANWQTASSQDANSITGDPLFLDTNNYTLQSGSPAKDTGLTINSVKTDFRYLLRPQGAGYDIGSYEFGNAINFSGVEIEGITVD